uniref:polymeric immunoglobulin receptor-like n=1 Tax=Semicossyphus pulcher TaxID=241346 RepID=UPI0037E6FD38
MKTWTPESVLLILCIALCCVMIAADVTHFFGYEGKTVNFSCPYEDNYESYEKYLCKDNCRNEDVLIKTEEANKPKYSIYDDQMKRIFSVTISDLSVNDAGQYWCMVSTFGKDIAAEVKLEVKTDSCCDQTTTVQSYEEDSVSLSCLYESEDENNRKYICRGKQPSTCLQQALITSDNNINGKFTLTDDKATRKFTVKITSLTRRDSGSYLCGVQRNNGLDVFSAVELEVKEWCCVNSSELSGTVGRPVTLQCPYPPQHRDNRKFLCKGDHRKNCADIVTSQSRFSLQDDISSSSFLVRITELKAEDAGTYWCGSDSQWSAGNYVKIQLSLVFPQQTSTVVEPSRSILTPTPGKPVKDTTLFLYVGVTVATVLLLLTISLVVIYKYKCCKVQGAGVNRNKPKKAEAEEQISLEDIYENQDVVACLQQRTSKQHSDRHQYDDAGEDQQNSVYQNFSTTEDIYCNQIS